MKQKKKAIKYLPKQRKQWQNINIKILVMWWIPILGVAGIITYLTTKKEIKKTDEIEDFTFGIKKSELPKKIRIWDDMKSANKDMNWKKGLMPKKYRHYQILIKNRWVDIGKQKFDNYFLWDDKSELDDGGNYYHKLKSDSKKKNPQIYTLGKRK